MKKYLFFLLVLPIISLAQVKTKAIKRAVASAKSTADSYSITGKITGYPDGTVVDLMNGNRGPEQTTKLDKGKFVFTGRMDNPDFKLLSFNKEAAYITLFLDNSNVTIAAAKDALDKAIIKGSRTNDDFMAYNKLVKPYEKLFTPEGKSADPAMAKTAATLLENFSKKNNGSYVAPLAIYWNYQFTEDSKLMQDLYENLTAEIKSSAIGKYIEQQIGEVLRNPMGKLLPDFSQEDTTGQLVSLSSLRGKYVLVDFWASWCGPCRQENPNVLNAFNRYRNKNFTVLGVSLDKDKQKWLDAINNDRLSWTHVSDLKGWQNSVAQQFGIQQIPQNFLIDPTGVVIGRNLRGPALNSKLATLLGN